MLPDRAEEAVRGDRRRPQQLRIDNLPAAVARVRTTKEEAIYTDAFQQFVTHYGFQVQSCNSYSGNEKGSVEKKVGYVRYNFLVPSPVMNDFDSLNRRLASSLRDDMERIHYEKKVRIKDLVVEEQKHLLRLPEEDFPVFREELLKVNKYGEVTIDRNKDPRSVWFSTWTSKSNPKMGRYENHFSSRRNPVRRKATLCDYETGVTLGKHSQ